MESGFIPLLKKALLFNIFIGAEYLLCRGITRLFPFPTVLITTTIR